MNHLRKLLSYSYLFIIGQQLFASQLENELSQSSEGYITGLSRRKQGLLTYGYHRGTYIPHALRQLIQHFLYGNPLEYKGKKLPPDLSGEDLRGFNFTGCNFCNTKLKGSNLTGAILTNTICDYREAFKKNILDLKKSTSNTRYCDTYIDELPATLESIHRVYPYVKDREKIKLLHITSELVWIPFLREDEFVYRKKYYVSQLLALRLKGGKNVGLKLPEESIIKQECNDCWLTEYKKSEQLTDQAVPHADFKKYVKEFNNGIVQYRCKRISDQPAHNDYKAIIINCLEGLEEAYQFMKTNKKAAKGLLKITQLLATSYQYGGPGLYIHYISCENRLLDLKNEIRNSL